MSKAELTRLSLECETLKAQLSESATDLTGSRAKIEEVKQLLATCEASLKNYAADLKKIQKSRDRWKATAVVAFLGAVAVAIHDWLD